MIRIYCFGTGLLLLSMIFVMPTRKKIPISVMMIVGCIFLVPTIPIGIAFANELSYPMDETVSMGFIMMAS
jgi:hypothetical protein